MHPQLERLYQLSQRDGRRIIGLMSGTSLDGLDVACCWVQGAGRATQVKLEHFTTVPYTAATKAAIRAVFAQKTIDFQHLALLHPHIGTLHGNMVNQCLQEWGLPAEQVDLIASHGQTVFHAPQMQHGLSDYGNTTLQIGDGDHLARVTGIITIADFRMRHVAAGGEGAPLAVYGDYFILAQPGEERILLNMGGIANFTYLPADQDATRVFTTDTGPGNTLLDATTRYFFPHLEYDPDGRLAQAGNLLPALLTKLREHSFFAAPLPKTTGPEVFNLDYVRAALQPQTINDFRPEDLLRTLVQLSADTIVAAIQPTIGHQPARIYLSGGGMHNPVLVQAIQAQLPHCRFGRTDELQIPGDAKEAILFAILANECVAGGQTHFGERQRVPTTSMGKICWPC